MLLRDLGGELHADVSTLEVEAPPLSRVGVVWVNGNRELAVELLDLERLGRAEGGLDQVLERALDEHLFGLLPEAFHELEANEFLDRTPVLGPYVILSVVSEYVVLEHIGGLELQGADQAVILPVLLGDDPAGPLPVGMS